jgi:hypothetical protein
VRSQNIVWGTVLMLAMTACSSKHTVGEGNPALGVVSITSPSTGIAPTIGAMTIDDAAVLMGAPFVGPTVPDAVPPGIPGVLTVQFTSTNAQLQANVKFRAGVYDFDFTTSNLTGTLANATINYDGGHAADHGSCVVWKSDSVVFTPGIVTDKLDGNWVGDCHHSDLARAGDRGVFHLTRPGTLKPTSPAPPPPCPEGQTRNNDGVCVAPPPPPPPPPPVVDVCANIDGAQATVPVGRIKVGDNCLVDVCPNIEGAQETLPAGKQIVNGQCVDVPVPSPDRTRVPASPFIVDTDLAVWTLGLGGEFREILRDGRQAAGGFGSQILWYQRVIYVRGDDNNWWRWTGNTWVFAGAQDPSE